MLGAHEGIIHYTIGQRKGLGGGSGEPLYVVKLDAVNKRVMVGPREALAQKEFSIKELNWLDSLTVRDGIRVKMRSAQPPVAATIIPAIDRKASIRLETPYEGIAPGQACVVYAGDRVLGGGWIAA